MRQARPTRFRKTALRRGETKDTRSVSRCFEGVRFLAATPHRSLSPSASPLYRARNRNQSQPICLSVYNTTLLGLINLAVQLVLAESPVVQVAASAFTAVAGTIFTVSVLFGPKVYQVWSGLRHRRNRVCSCEHLNTPSNDTANCVLQHCNEVPSPMILISAVHPSSLSTLLHHSNPGAKSDPCLPMSLLSALLAPGPRSLSKCLSHLSSTPVLSNVTDPPPQLWWYGDLASNPAERRRSSGTKGSYGQRGSSQTTGRTATEMSITGTGGGLQRKKSSVSTVIDFFKIGKILPVNEDPRPNASLQLAPT